MKNPIQPLANDEHGVMRFKANAIVQYLLDTHTTCDLNKLARMNFTDDDRQQFAQLTGYSLGGYSELRSYVDDEAYSTAAHMADGIDERDARIAAMNGDEKKSVDGLGFEPPREIWVVSSMEGCDFVAERHDFALEHAGIMAVDFPELGPWRVCKYVAEPFSKPNVWLRHEK